MSNHSIEIIKLLLGIHSKYHLK